MWSFAHRDSTAARWFGNVDGVTRMEVRYGNHAESHDRAGA